MPRAQRRTSFGTLREFGGWLGVWNCDDGSFLSEQGLPNFLPTVLGGGDNGVIHGDFGYSISQGRPVIDMIVERIPATLILMLTAFVIWVSIAVVLGVIAAVKRYSLFDQGVTLLQLHLLLAADLLARASSSSTSSRSSCAGCPSQGIVDPREAPGGLQHARSTGQGFWADPIPNILDIARHLVLPVVTLVAVSVAADSRFVRSSMLDTLSQDYVRTARAKGLPAPARRLPPRLPQRACCPIITTIVARTSPSCSAAPS